MRKLALIAFTLVVFSCAYAAWPLMVGLQLRSAIKSGDIATLERLVDWPAVRLSLKRSAGTTGALMQDVAVDQAASSGLLGRIRRAAAPYLVEPLIDRYVNARSVPQLLAWRRSWHERVRPVIGLSRPATVFAGTMFGDTWIDRGLSALRRIEKAAFVGTSRVELIVRDRLSPDRRWFAAMFRDGVQWRLVEVRLLGSRDDVLVGSHLSGLSRPGGARDAQLE